MVLRAENSCISVNEYRFVGAEEELTAKERTVLYENSAARVCSVVESALNSSCIECFSVANSIVRSRLYVEYLSAGNNASAEVSVIVNADLAYKKLCSRTCVESCANDLAASVHFHSLCTESAVNPYVKYAACSVEHDLYKDLIFGGIIEPVCKTNVNGAPLVSV